MFVETPVIHDLITTGERNVDACDITCLNRIPVFVTVC